MDDFGSRRIGPMVTLKHKIAGVGGVDSTIVNTDNR